jgi:hypothetical protein
MRWRISEEHNEHGFATNTRSWMHRAVRFEYPDDPDGLTVDPRTFALRFDDTGVRIGQDFSVQVSSADPAAARAALAAAAARFAVVAADGREFADGDELVAEDPHLYTPNSVSDPEDHADGPWIYCDCKDGTMPLMARTMLRIVVEELRAAGVTNAQLRPGPW